MKIYNDILEFQPVNKPIVTIGTFDGIHLGHQAILEKMVHEAAEIGGAHEGREAGQPIHHRSNSSIPFRDARNDSLIPID